MMSRLVWFNVSSILILYFFKFVLIQKTEVFWESSFQLTLKSVSVLIMLIGWKTLSASLGLPFNVVKCTLLDVNNSVSKLGKLLENRIVFEKGFLGWNIFHNKVLLRVVYRLRGLLGSFATF